MEFCELYHVDSSDALNFFFDAIREKGVAADVSADERYHVASVLASFAMTSRADIEHPDVPADLTEVFDKSLFKPEKMDRERIESVGAECLLLAGFFRDQMRRRHNVPWFDRVGSAFYLKASRLSRSQRRRILFFKMSVHFRPWAHACCDIRRALAENRYLLHL